MTEPVRLERGRTRPTRRAGLYFVLGGLLYASGANVDAGWVVAIAGLMLGALPWGWVSARRAAGHVTVARDLPRAATAGAPVAVCLEVHAPTTAALLVRDHLAGTVAVATDPREGVRLEGTTTFDRGVVDGGTIEVVVTDPFGLFRSSATSQVPGRIEVLPAVPVTRIRDRVAAGATGEDTSLARGGVGPEPVGVRGYVHGDPVRTIHWRSTARAGHLVVSELAQPTQPSLEVVLASGPWTRSALDRACEAAAALAAAASASGQPVTVAADGVRVPWGRPARRLLAELPPHLGADARPLAGVAARSEVVMTLAPAEPEGVSVRIGPDGTGIVGILSEAADVDVGAWLRARLAGRS